MLPQLDMKERALDDRGVVRMNDNGRSSHFVDAEVSDKLPLGSTRGQAASLIVCLILFHLVAFLRLF